ncbi:replication factor-A protein 1 [Coniophora puteana RWD-64-598 SS2]|uniref:Replication protein A subunit n=1 Tax=Coniophora puteana (strain RWD-64-598) TaxID=741705 RepID=A0A5M3N0T2_CONPW|nr:replication factor-A protein 1 [Coniophora puteana RWD-64-598 SS2]EIW84857.1 replication factor-A protein 1 [Coniophora puteana RWD-64-598 SS2]
MTQLSAGICQRLQEATPEDIDNIGSGHTVQLLSIKKVSQSANSSNTVDRYRLIISDGVHFIQAMLATKLNDLVANNELGKNTVVIIDQLTCNFVQEKRLIIVLNLQVLTRDEEKIGTPSPPPSVAAAAAAAGAGPSAAPQQSTSNAQPVRSSAAARQTQTKGRNVFPIEGLSPYQNNWTIKARVTQKSEVRNWSNARGEGKLFNVTLMDESGEIRATGFNAVVDELYPKLEEGKVYYVSKARVNLAKKKFSNIQNDYELSLEKNTEVEECLDTTNLPTIKYNFISLGELESLAKDVNCDVIGIVKEAGPLSEITSKTNRTIPKRELTIVDKSQFSVRMTLWGKQAELYSAEDQPVIAFKGVKVGDYGGRSLSMMSSSLMSISPDIPEAHALRGWYDGIGNEKTFTAQSSAVPLGASFGGFNRSELRHISDVKDSQLGMGDKADFFSTRASIMHIKTENIAYPACANQGCNKKVTDVGDGWRCEKCDKTFERPEYRYIVSIAVADWSGQAWLQGFNDAGEAIFGKSADEVMEIKNCDEQEYNAVMAQATGVTFNFGCRAKQDTYNDNTRVRYGISKILSVDYREEAKHLVELLQSDWAQ